MGRGRGRGNGQGLGLGLGLGPGPGLGPGQGLGLGLVLDRILLGLGWAIDEGLNKTRIVGTDNQIRRQVHNNLSLLNHE